MIQANELRIGNLVYEEKNPQDAGNPQGDWIRKANINVIEFAHHFKPIPITPEWLERFGFKKTKVEYGSELWDNQEGLVRLYRMLLGKDKGIVFANGLIVDIRLEYIHQLQNLYFALTGQELELKQES